MAIMKQAAVLWAGGPVAGQVELAHGELASLKLAEGNGRVHGADFSVASRGPCRLVIACAEAKTGPGACATRVTVATKENPFTFFLRDVNRKTPIFLAEYGAIVTEAGDGRTYAEIVEAIRGQALVSPLAAIENAPEESYAEACRENLDLGCPTWLGLSRDMRFFEVHPHVMCLYGGSPQFRFGYWGYVRPRYHTMLQSVPETDKNPYALHFVVGPGSSCRIKLVRRLEEGILPILHSTQEEEDIRYELKMFATLETQPVTQANLRGSEWQACYPNTGGHMLQPEEKEKLRDLLDREMHQREEETVCRIRIEAVNHGSVPRYAWFRGLAVACGGRKGTDDYDGRTGFAQFKSGRVFGIHRLNGKPAPDQEMAVLVQPHEAVTYEILVPHQPISADRAKKLAQQDFETHLSACRTFWKAKLQKAASVSIPEPAIDERIKAGLLHCDIAALGREPKGSVLATIGLYAPIGSESAPIIQFFDSMGWHDLAERSIEFFLDRQKEDGFIQNFAGYQLETGPALWTMGEHFRYTRDLSWVRRVQPKILKACDYLLAWREQNKTPDLRGKGYGLMSGKVADPDDFFHSFMLNGYAYLGLQRASEMLADLAPARSKHLAAEAAAFRKDIRTAFFEAMGRAPAVALGDGTWVPSVPPWTEYPGPVSLYADGGNWHSHGTFSVRDSVIGAIHLAICEVLDPNEIGAEILLKGHQELFTVKNVGLMQPYYCRHDYLHLLRDEVKPFLKTFYNAFASLQDRQTYTFWECYYGVSQHKTHEEGWFLMQTRWMLLMEENATLRMLRGIPRAWLANGKRLAFDGMKTYFGAVSLEVESRLDEGFIEARYTLDPKRKPGELLLRLPHPDGRTAGHVSGGTYDPGTETVRVANPARQGTVRLSFREKSRT